MPSALAGCMVPPGSPERAEHASSMWPNGASTRTPVVSHPKSVRVGALIIGIGFFWGGGILL